MPDTVPELKSRLAYLGLGGNTGEVKSSFALALRELATGISDALRCSRLYRSSAWGLTEQPDFLNMAVEIPWTGTAQGLLMITRSIEQNLGRNRPAEIHWGPRPIDIDILFISGLQLATEKLTVPHPRLHERLFVLNPLMDLLSGNSILPGYEQDLESLQNTCPDKGEVMALTHGPWNAWRETDFPT